jgi:hypothetical protein
MLTEILSFTNVYGGILQRGRMRRHAGLWTNPRMRRRLRSADPTVYIIGPRCDTPALEHHTVLPQRQPSRVDTTVMLCIESSTDEVYSDRISVVLISTHDILSHNLYAHVLVVLTLVWLSAQKKRFWNRDLNAGCWWLWDALGAISTISLCESRQWLMACLLTAVSLT